MSTHTLGLIGSATDGLENIRTALVEPAIERGWQVAVTLTPTAGTWLEDTGELARIEAATGLPCRVAPRMPREASPHPPIDCFLVCPASANTVAKLALGLADNQALTTVCEAIGVQSVPIVVFPLVNAAHVRHPAWNAHLAALREAGVHLLTGDEYWPLHEPRSAPAGKDLPWDKILDAVESASG
ncbi:flavoprotein [Actinopolyspora saharensis]|uniref:Flavoprotein n=1 Tax=Actinopolyspora saharensis TaxID=995062 RepID=A0A1H1FW26_9ACTN|nr:flavoprotein [Actinopolyspora saharensis]SDR05115.1 Flavoprotein [Actinopolyspora saharensis]